MRIAVDSSAIVAIILSEAEADTFQSLLVINEALTSGHVLVEVIMVLTGRGVPHAKQELDTLLGSVQMKIVSFDVAMAALAQQAFLDFGKGRHPARLNFGDCMSYAVAKALDVPLLWKGEDFDLTDVPRLP